MTVARLPEDALRVLLSVNPKAGRQGQEQRVEGLMACLRARGFEPERLGDLAEVAARANHDHAEGRLRALVAVGGDGTVAELVNRTLPGVPITVFPAGTANLLAKYFRLPSDPEAMAEVIAAGNLQRLDAGSAAGRVFLSMVSCGLDAAVVEQVHRQRARARGGHITYWSYIKPILDAMRSYACPEIRIYYTDKPEEGGQRWISARWALALNLPRYAWGVSLAPKADMSDGQLDLCAFAQGSFWHGLRYVLAAHWGCHERLADCRTERVRWLRFTSEAAGVPYQVDGDPGGQLPVDIEVLPARLTLLAPPLAAVG